MKTFIQSLAIVATLTTVAAPVVHAGPTPRPKDACIVNLSASGSATNTFVFRDVKPLAAGGVIPLDGLFFTAARKLEPVHGSAVMAADGSVRIGLFVHSSAASTNDFTMSGIAASDFSGTLNYDTNGDFVPDGTLVMTATDCTTIVIP